MSPCVTLLVRSSFLIWRGCFCVLCFLRRPLPHPNLQISFFRAEWLRVKVQRRSSCLNLTREAMLLTLGFPTASRSLRLTLWNPRHLLWTLLVCFPYNYTWQQMSMRTDWRDLWPDMVSKSGAKRNSSLFFFCCCLKENDTEMLH